jgi:hypothetical protein
VEDDSGEDYSTLQATRLQLRADPCHQGAVQRTQNWCWRLCRDIQLRHAAGHLITSHQLFRKGIHRDAGQPPGRHEGLAEGLHSRKKSITSRSSVSLQPWALTGIGTRCAYRSCTSCALRIRFIWRPRDTRNWPMDC